MKSRIFGRIVAGLVVITALAAGIALVVVRRQLPDRQAPPLPGLTAATEVDLDAREIPTVRAATLLDALRVQGYLVARERLFQMEIQRRAAEGTLAAIFGAGALPVDRMHRIYGFGAIAEAAAARLPPDQREQLDAYAAGVNAFIDGHPGRWGLELQLLGLTPRPWSAAQSLAVLLLMHEDLASTWKDELRAEALARLPIAQQRFLMPRATDRDVLVVPDAEPRPPLDAASLFDAPHALVAPFELPRDPWGLPRSAGERAESIGSNNWVVAGTRSTSGKALLANDPHLGLSAPGIWYAMRIELGTRWMQGVALVGIPGLVIGQTDRIAWGFTNLGTDVQDLYREPAIGERIERIDVKGGASEELHVAIGRHGPHVRPGYALRWAALEPENLRLPLGAVMTAVDWASFNTALDGYTGPAQNVVYADVDGHIGYRATGLVPIRRDTEDGAHPLDGADPANDWRGYVPMAQMPRVVDPPQGYLVTANQRVIGSSFPHVIATHWVNANRARRIVERIEAVPKLDRDEMARIQLDVVSPFHRELMEELTRLLPAGTLARFAGWNGAADADGTLFLEARAWQTALRHALYARLLGDPDADFAWDNDMATLLTMLRADDAAWTRAGLGDKSAFLHDAQAREAAALATEHGRSWGEANALGIHHPFGYGGGLLAWLFDPPSHPQSGGPSTVRASSPDFGQSMRLVVDWSAPQLTTLVIPLGQSGHLGSVHRHDQQADWLRGDPGGERTRFLAPAVGPSMTFEPR
jgi:penicillin amidase